MIVSYHSESEIIMRLVVSLFVVLFVVSACQTTPAKVVTFDTVCTAENVNQRVAISGYAFLPSTVILSSGSMLIEFYENVSEQGKMLKVDFNVGSGSNQLAELPDNYTDGDLLIRTNDNKETRYGDKISVEGRLIRNTDSNDPSGYSCMLMDVGNIQSVSN